MTSMTNVFGVGKRGRLYGGCEEDTGGRESDLWIMWRRMDDGGNKDVEK
jgi:hypothetical protein